MPNAKVKTRDIKRHKAEQLRKQKLDENPPRCALSDCSKVIPAPRRYARNVKYCSQEHTTKAADRRKNQKEQLEKAKNLDLQGSELYPDHRIRRGPLLNEIRQTLDPMEYEEWVQQRIADVKVAKKVNATGAAVGMARRAAWNDKLLAAAGKAFVPDAKYLRMLGPTDKDMIELRDSDADGYDRMLDRLVDAFVEWRDEFFKATSEGTYITKPFHRRWIKATLNTIYTGGRQLILSPPRHGKTDLLIHFCVWLIIRDPMIRILWVGPSDDIAKNSLGQVRNILSTHEELREAYLGTQHHWQPQNRNGLWQDGRFTVDNRPHPRKQPTMWCAGVTSRILSLDADFIVVDDPADPDESATEGGREKIEGRFRKKLLSRKMHGTGLVMISSRVHPLDLYYNYVDSKHWDVMVDRSHNGEICGKDLFENHDDQECVLFPEMNPLDYLRLQHDDVGPALFDMMYQNNPRPDGTMIFDIDQIKDICLDRSRDLGLRDLPHPYRLVAGLDPAARGVQAAFLWAVRLPTFYSDYDPTDPRWRERDIESYYMIDMEAQQAGGIEGAVKIMKDWFIKYGCELWYVEDNSYQKVFFDDPRVKELERTLLLDVKTANTDGQTYDPQFGISSLAPLYHEGKVVLPYATPEAQRKTNALLHQLTNFTGDKPKKQGQSDILMASWFPHAKAIRRWRRDAQRKQVRPSDPVSYPGYSSSTPITLPWDATDYPGTQPTYPGVN